VLAGCALTGKDDGEPVADNAPPPLSRPAEQSAYDLAGSAKLPEVKAKDLDGLHNVFRLSDNIVSGGEPENEAALKAIAEMGVKTILTVDGKVPDYETAARYGLRYVHVPIRYRGIEDDEVLAIAKTFRELEGPFYVHCFHGQHRGPAAAAIGRLVLDGADRAQAIGEMRQYCGTSKKYEGLYAEIAFDDMPTVAETRAFDFDFPSAHRIAGVRQGMIDLTRSWDTIVELADLDWQVNPDHPDASAVNEARKVAEIFEQSAQLEETADRPEDFRTWMTESATDARKLVDLLESFNSGDKAAGEPAQDMVAAIGKHCSACHSKYRNN
jgi:protein tyrosine phosphatase (PTP) superfamily phosphohydrolase (DUF442 family)